MGRGRGSGRHDGGWSDLEVLDPATGEAVRADDPAPAAPIPVGARPLVRRRRRLRRLTGALTLLAVLCGVLAGHRAFTIGSARAIDRTWAEAMALDRSRKAADALVLELARSLGAERDDETRRVSLGRIGDEVTAGLLRHEDRLRDHLILDDRLARVRDDMLEALQFRRYQLSPNRAILGDRPLVRVEEDLEAQLDRFGLSRSTAPRPTVRAVRPVVAALRRFSSEPTGTVLVAAATGRRLLTIDVDASTVRTRVLPADAVHLFASYDVAVVQADDGSVTGYPLDPGAPPAWTIVGSAAVAGRRGADEAAVVAWVQAPEGLVAVGVDGRPRPPVPVPGDLELLAETDLGLLLRDRAGLLHLHDPVSGSRTRSLTTGGRFAGGSAQYVALQQGTPVLVLLRLADGRTFPVPLPRTDAGDLVPRPGAEGAFAFAAGPLAGNIASVLSVEVDGITVTAVDGPRATVESGTLTWSPDGEHLFWATPDGRLAHRGTEHAAVLRAPVEDVSHVAAFAAPPRR